MTGASMEVLAQAVHRFGPGEWGVVRTHHLFWPWGGLLMWGVVVALLTMVLVALLRRRDTGSTPAGPAAAPPAPPAAPATPATPLDAAKMRYAKGEITKEEFEALRKDLE